MQLDELLGTLCSDWEEQKREHWRRQGFTRSSSYFPAIAGERSVLDRLIDQDHFDMILRMNQLEERWYRQYHGGGVLVQIALHGLPRLELLCLHAHYLTDMPSVLKAELCGISQSTFSRCLRGARLWIMARVSQYNADLPGRLSHLIPSIDSRHQTGIVIEDIKAQLVGVPAFEQLARDWPTA